MARIRKNRSASVQAKAKDGGSQPESRPSHAEGVGNDSTPMALKNSQPDSEQSHALVVANDSHTENTGGQPRSFRTLPLVDDHAKYLLSAPRLRSGRRQNSGFRNLKEEDVPAEVKAAVRKANHYSRTQQQVDYFTGNVSYERTYERSSVRRNNGTGHAACGRAIGLFETYTPLETINEDPNEGETESISNNPDESDFSARMENSERGPVAFGAEAMEGLTLEPSHAYSLEGQPSSKVNSGNKQQLASGHSIIPSEFALMDLPLKVDGECRTDENIHTPASAEGVHSNIESNKPEIADSKDQIAVLEGATNALVRRLLCNITDAGHNSRCPSAALEGFSLCKHHLSEASHKYLEGFIDGGWMNQPKATSENSDESGNESENLGDRYRLQAHVETLTMTAINDTKNHSTAINDTKNHSKQSHDAVTIAGDGTRVGADAPQMVESGPQKRAFGEEWTARWLAQIAELDEATSNGQSKRLCKVTNGVDWRCPSNAVEASCHCQQHRRKASLNHMRVRRNRAEAESEVVSMDFDDGTQMMETDAQQAPTAGEAFREERTHHGVAQMGEETSAQQVEGPDRCTRTDGANGRCPLKVFEDFNLCIQHLNEDRAKKGKQKISNPVGVVFEGSSSGQ